MEGDDIQSNVISHAQADLANVPGASGRYQEVIEPISAAPSTESVMYGLWREGLKDLQNAVLDPWGGYAGTHEEIGTIANPTQIEVNQDRGVSEISSDQGSVYGSADMAAYQAQLDGITSHGRQEPSRELEM